jgi:hypothetical protein
MIPIASILCNGLMPGASLDIKNAHNNIKKKKKKKETPPKIRDSE